MQQSGIRSVIAALSLVAGSIFTSGASAAEPATAAQWVVQLQAEDGGRAALLAEGRKAASFCANCHGEAGISRYPEVPNLAGQHPAYVLGQIEAFVSGKRKDTFMEGLMKVLGERDKAAIAMYYASAPVVPATGAGARAEEGGKHFARLCARCHQADARGGEAFPRLAGQQREYVRTSLKRYLTQSGGRLYAPMTAAVTQLGAGNIDAVADYLSTLK